MAATLWVSQYLDQVTHALPGNSETLQKYKREIDLELSRLQQEDHVILPIPAVPDSLISLGTTPRKAVEVYQRIAKEMLETNRTLRKSILITKPEAKLPHTVFGESKDEDIEKRIGMVLVSSPSELAASHPSKNTTLNWKRRSCMI